MADIINEQIPGVISTEQARARRQGAGLYRPVSVGKVLAMCTGGDQPDAASSLPLRCLTIDVEDYYHIEAARGAVGRDQWDSLPARIEKSTDILLELFARCGRKGTFFILGDVSRRFPQLARRIADAGHEIASHGCNHDRLHRLDARSLLADLKEGKQRLEDQTGRAVIGYRAPTFSITRSTSWAVDVLVEAGFAYDTSVFPVVHPSYGVQEAPARPFYLQGQPGGAEMLEIPPLTWRVLGRNIAVAGGGYFRLLPLWFMNRGLKQAASRRRPAVLYFHPWEFDPAMPRLPLSLAGRIRTYTGLKSSAARLERIMRQTAQWSTIADSLDTLRAHADAAERFCLSGRGAADGSSKTDS